MAKKGSGLPTKKEMIDAFGKGYKKTTTFKTLKAKYGGKWKGGGG